MPIIDIQIVLNRDETLREGLAQDLVDRMGQVLGVKPGSLWLRLQTLPSSNYAENDAQLEPPALPIFLTVMHAQSPTGAALQAQATALAQAVAAAVGRPRTKVHVEYAPEGAGRIAVGGNLVQ